MDDRWTFRREELQPDLDPGIVSPKSSTKLTAEAKFGTSSATMIFL